QATHQRSRTMPADHPAHVHLAESRLNLAVLGFLGAAVFGADRESYWRANLAQAEAAPPAPVQGRIDELEAEIDELDRRRQRQVLALEAEETTPSLFRLIAKRVVELEDVIEQGRARLEHL